jgi:DGQHR domain-containing protein
MEMITDNTILARRVKQNNQEFLLGIFSIRQILSFTRYTERLIDRFDDNNFPVYNPRVQRKLENSRVVKIADFLIDDPDAIFPTNIVISIPSAGIESIEDDGSGVTSVKIDQKVFDQIQLQNGDVYFTIIDGQHRISGIELAIKRIREELVELNAVLRNSNSNSIKKKLEKRQTQLSNLLGINLVVTFFIDPTLEFQAMIFSTINRTQKSVPQSLVSSLFGLTERDTPQKSALEIVLALNAFELSPFYNRIKLHGGKYERNESPPLTQAGMVKSIVDLISTNQRELERDRFRERNELIINCSADLPFRVYYAKNNDKFITDIMFSYFAAVRQTFVLNNIVLWDFEENTKPTNILHTTVGYLALLNLLIEILKIEKDNNSRDRIETYKSYLRKCVNIEFANQQRYPFTSISKSILFFDLSLRIWPPQNQDDNRIIKRDELLNR